MNNPDQGETRNIFLLNSQAEAGMSVGLGAVAPAASRLASFRSPPARSLLNLWVLEQGHVQGDALSLMLLVGMRTGSRRQRQLLVPEMKEPL